MAFPVVAARITGRTTNTNTTTHAITLPAGAAAGDLLVVVFSVDGNPTVTAQQAGWTKLNQASNGTVVTGAVFYKVATGSDALTLTTSATEASSHASFRITGAASTITATSAVATSTNTNPPAHTPPGGLADYLWIATRAADSTNVATAAPANYANLQTLAATGTNGASTNTAERSLAAAAEDPGTFTSGTSIAWVSWTIAVPPAPPAAQSRTMELLASAAVVGAPQVIAPQTVVPTPLAAASTVGSPTIARTLTVTLAPVAAASTAPAPTVTTTITRTVVAVASTATVATPTVIGEQLLTAVFLASTATVATPTVATRYPVTVASTSSVAAPTVATRYPLTVDSTTTVGGPTVVIRVLPATVVNQPALLKTSPGLAPSTTLLPSTGGDRFFPPSTTVNLHQTTLPERVGPATTVEAPTVVAGGVTATPTTVTTSPTVGQPTIDTVTLHRYPWPIHRAVVPSLTLAPSTHLVLTTGLSVVYAPRAWVGQLQTATVETVPSTAAIPTPTAVAIVAPRSLTRVRVPRPDLAPSAGLTTSNAQSPSAGLSTVHPPSIAAATVVSPTTVPPTPPFSVPLHPARDLYPGTDLRPGGVLPRNPTLQLGPVTLAPATAPAVAVVHPPAVTGSGVNFVPLLAPAPIPSAAAVGAPTVWTAELAVDVEFVDSAESVEPPNVVLQGELLLTPTHLASTSAVLAPDLSRQAAQVSPLLVASTAAVGAPQVAAPSLQTLTPATVGATAVVHRPRPPGGPPTRPRPGAPVVALPLRAGPPAAPATTAAGRPAPVAPVAAAVPVPV